MMGAFPSVSGFVQVRIVSADVAECLRQIDLEQITAYSVRMIDSVTLELTVSRQDLQKLQKLCERKGYTLNVVQKLGFYWILRSMLMRPIFVIGLLLLIILAVCLPGRILFVETEGNDTVPSRYILDRAEEYGLKFWTRRREIRSEVIKNGLLEEIPQLQWVGVNTYGCRAVITVRERPPQPDEQSGSAVSHIAAARDGVIQSCTVTRGYGNCSVGQAVRKGDILISGYTDCGICYTAERAEGEIHGQTQRSIRVVTPEMCHIQSPTDHAETKFSLIIGKKRINFYKGSGISGATCDKMYSKYVLTLPGGFPLPVALVKEIIISCDLMEATVPYPVPLLKFCASDYLMEQMHDGMILQKSEAVSASDGAVYLHGIYDCLENIGIVQEEKIGEFNGETDGTDRERRSG